MNYISRPRPDLRDHRDSLRIPLPFKNKFCKLVISINVWTAFTPYRKNQTTPTPTELDRFLANHCIQINQMLFRNSHFTAISIDNNLLEITRVTKVHTDYSPRINKLHGLHHKPHWQIGSRQKLTTYHHHNTCDYTHFHNLAI